MLFSIVCVILLVAGIHGFKIGEDSPYAAFSYKTYLAERTANQRLKFATSQVESFSPTGSYILVLDPAHSAKGIAPLDHYSSGFQPSVTSVVAVGPDVKGIAEGDLVYTSAPDCPIERRMQLNKATGDTAGRICRAVPGTNWGNTITHHLWCQIRNCNPIYADKCQWFDLRTTSAFTPTSYEARDVKNQYCILDTTANEIFGLVKVASYGVNTNSKFQSRINKPRANFLAARMENLNLDLPTGL